MCKRNQHFSSSDGLGVNVSPAGSCGLGNWLSSLQRHTSGELVIHFTPGVSGNALLSGLEIVP